VPIVIQAAGHDLLIYCANTLPEGAMSPVDSSNGSSNGWGVTRGYPQVPAITRIP